MNLPGVDWIVQYDPPSSARDYVHRSGRTARGGKRGCSVLFLLPTETDYLKVLKREGVKGDIDMVSLEDTLGKAADLCRGVTREGVRRGTGGYKGGRGGGKGGGGNGIAFANEVMRRMEGEVEEDERRASRARKKAEDVAGEGNEGKGGEGKVGKGGWREMKHGKKSSSDSRPTLISLARSAYTSYIRSYSAKDKSLKKIFNGRLLHLGHVAKSFAVKDKPGDIGRNREGKKRKGG